MGLDMYAYVSTNANSRGELYDGSVVKPREIAYWRKHPDLHGYMEQLWQKKGMPGTGDTCADFNGIELELTWEDLDELERAIAHKQLPHTEGFFFGNSGNDTKEGDLAFVRKARAEIFLGLKVFYNSSW